MIRQACRVDKSLVNEDGLHVFAQQTDLCEAEDIHYDFKNVVVVGCIVKLTQRHCDPANEMEKCIAPPDDRLIAVDFFVDLLIDKACVFGYPHFEDHGKEQRELNGD